MGIPKKYDSEWEYDALFLGYQADPKYAKEEKPGNQDYKGRDLPYLRSILQIDVPPLEASLESLLKHAWKPGVVRSDAPQRGFIGRHRDKEILPDVPEPYTRIPNPSKFTLPANAPPGTGDYLKGIARDWTHQLDIQRVTGYCFRGDTRSPKEIKEKYKGFHPNSTRDDDKNYMEKKVFPAFQDYLDRRFKKKITLNEFNDALNKSMDQDKRKLFIEYSVWRELLRGEEMHLGRMMANELFKGYTSNTKSVLVAKGYTYSDGWVYCLLIEGGYLVPKRGEDEWTMIFGEQEIAYPGSVPWSSVYGFRHVTNKKFEGPVYLHANFLGFDKAPAETVYNLLSGQDQEK